MNAAHRFFVRQVATTKPFQIVHQHPNGAVYVITHVADGEKAEKLVQALNEHFTAILNA